MKRFSRAVKRFFYPAPDAKRWVKILPYATLSVLFILIVVASAYGWEYTNSSEFCASACGV